MKSLFLYLKKLSQHDYRKFVKYFRLINCLISLSYTNTIIIFVIFPLFFHMHIKVFWIVNIITSLSLNCKLLFKMREIGRMGFNCILLSMTLLPLHAISIRSQRPEIISEKLRIINNKWLNWVPLWCMKTGNKISYRFKCINFRNHIGWHGFTFKLWTIVVKANSVLLIFSSWKTRLFFLAFSTKKLFHSHFSIVE